MKRIQKLKKREMSKNKLCEAYMNRNSTISVANKTTRKKVKRIYASKEKRRKSRIIIQEVTKNLNAAQEFKDLKKGKEASRDRNESLPKVGILHSIKNLNFFGFNMSRGNGVRLMALEKPRPEYLPTIENSSIYGAKNNKSYDDLMRTMKKKRKRIKKIINAARVRITHLTPESFPMISKMSQKLFSSSGMRLLKTLLEKEESFGNPLTNHEVTAKMRAKMVDWMIEVFAVYKKSEDTYFEAVYLLDKYLAQTDDMLEDSQVHLTGVA